MNKRYCECGCGQEIKNFTRFAGKEHEKAYFKTNDRLLCECGCGLPVAYNGQRYPRYIDGHQHKPHIDWQARAEHIVSQAPNCMCGCGNKVHVNPERVISHRAGPDNFRYPKYIRGHGIRRVDQSLDLNEEEKNLVIGTCLGDGSIQYPHSESKHPRLVINHGRIQHAYNCIKASIIARFDPSLNIVRNGGHGDYNSRLMTICHRVFEPLYLLFYKEAGKRRRKRITEEIYAYLNESVLTWWFLDDGSNSMLRNSSIPHVCMSTDGFPKEDVVLLADMLYQKFGLKGITSQTRKYWYIRFNKEDSLSFIDMIKDRIPSCMMYKIKGLL